MALLADINSPSDLKRLNQQQLTQLAAEVRAFLVEHIAKTGGHLSPNLGVVELTFALHRVFDSPKDAIVWDTAHQAAYRVKEGLKQLLQPSTVFESLGIKYAGLVDGHDEAALEQVLRRASRLTEPVVVHVVTEKGHGYGPAVEDEIDKLHGVSAFDPLTGRPLRTELTYTDVFGDALLAAATTHPDVCAVTAAMASSTGLLNFAKEFPDRFFDVGICEQHAVTFAAGLAMAGMHPVVCIYSTFLARAFDQTIMDVALHKLPVVFVIDRAGVTGPDGASHHGIFDLSYLRMIPNLKVAAPKDATELCALLETALATDGPVAIRYPRGPVPATPDLPVEPLPVGRWEEIRKGDDAVIFAVGRMVEVAGEAAQRLEMQGLSCGVVNARWIKPVDPRIADWARAHPVVLTVEDNVGSGGFGGAVLEALAPHGLAGRVRLLALPDAFLPQGKASDILKEHGLDAAGIAKAVYEAVRGRVE